MKHVFVASKKAAWVVFISLGLGLAGLAHAESGTSGKDTLAASGAGIMDDNPTRGGTEKSLGSSRSGSSGSGAASGSSSSTPPQGSTPGGSTGDKGFSNLRENKGGSGSQSTLGGSTDSKAGDAGTGGGTGGSSTGGSK